jgi:hypothetical protein
MSFARGRSVFEGVGNVQLNGPKVPFLTPKNIRRDLSLPPDGNIVSSEDCTYVCSIDKFTYEESKNPRKRGKAYIRVRFTILWTDGQMVVGTKAVYMMDTGGQYFIDDVARVVTAAMNMPPSAFSPQDYETVTGPTQPLTQAQRCVKILVRNKKTGVQKDFSQHFFSPIGVSFSAPGVVSNIFEVENHANPQPAQA